MKIDRQAVYNKYDGHCAYCGRKIEYKDMQVDHLVSKCTYEYEKLEGDYDKIENLMPSCRRCNHYKRAWDLDYYRKLLQDIKRKLLDDSYLGKVAMDYGMVAWNGWDGKFYFEKQNSAVIEKE